MNIIGKRKIYFALSGFLVSLSILGLLLWGVKLGIDFTGGSLLEVEFSNSRPSITEVEKKLSSFSLGEVKVQPIGEKGMLIRFKDIDEETHQKVLSALMNKKDVSLPEENKQSEEKIASSTNSLIGAVSSAEKKVSANKEEMKSTNSESVLVEKRFESIGPIIGNELKNKTVAAIILAIAGIILFIAWSFRQVSRPISSWRYGVIAVVALFHDILITVGLFVFLGHFYGLEVNAPFVAALLTILGYSVNDTIVIFDRIRENLKYYTHNFEEVVNKSVNQNFLRSLYTSFTTLLVLVAMYFFGGDSIKNFVLALIGGIAIGTYSSIFLASPLLVVWEKQKNKF